MDIEKYVVENIAAALENNYIQVYYQPVIRTISRKLCSFEGLARWIDPEIGMIRPDQFIPVLERASKIHILDRHIIREVCKLLRNTMDVGGIPIPEDNFEAMKKFNAAFDTFHERKYRFHIFPEAARWDYYKPLRPFSKGA